MKQRLVGAVVLVSLAVIFIPMLLDGGKQEGMPTFGSNIPEKPDYHFEPLEIPLQPVEPIPEDRPQLIEESEPAPAKPVPPAEAKPSPAAKRKPIAKPKPESKPEVASTPATEPVGWVVQVGSFSQADNAMALRDKLRGAGFTAFVEKLKTGEGTVYRVRVGPELRREAAEAQLEKLKRTQQLDGIVMGHGS